MQDFGLVIASAGKTVTISISTTFRVNQLHKKFINSFRHLLLLLLLLATVTYNQVQSYQVNLLQQIIKTAKCHCCVAIYGS